MTRLLLTAALLAVLGPALGGCWLAASTRVGIDDDGSFVGYTPPVMRLPGPDVGTEAEVRVD